MEYITIFGAQDNNSKVPYSPFNDKTFDFRTFQTDDIRKLFNTMVSNWVLNVPLDKIDSTGYIKRRKKSALEGACADKLSYIVLDLDDIISKDAQEYCLNFFKDYKCIIGESKTANDINKFNLKGLLFVESLSIGDAKKLVSEFNHALKGYCTVDEAVTRIASFNAPIGKNKILLENTSGPRYKYIPKHIVEHSDEVAKEYLQKVNIDIDAFTDLEGSTIQELCLNMFKTMQFEPIKNNPNGSITFKHPDEKKSVGGFFWFPDNPYLMNHNNSTKRVDIYNIIIKSEQGKSLLKQEISYDDVLLNFDTNTKIINVDMQFLEVTDEIEDSIDEWLEKNNGLFSIKSPMGTGKSTIIQHIIEEAHELDMKVLIITNRRSVASDFAKRYKLKHYQLDHYNIGDSIVVQYDSLWRYDIQKFDVIIMDEFISLMTHSRNNMNNSSLNIAKFFACFNKKLVIADAFLTGYENFLLSSKKSNIVQIDNHWRDNTVLYDYEDESHFINQIMLTAKEFKCTVSATSLAFLSSVRILLQERGLNVVMLTADTDETTKQLIYDLFEENDHDKWDVFLYSPTLTVGVSNLNNVRYHFHYDSSMSTDVISSIQMIKRTRKAKEIHTYIKDRIRFLKTSYNTIRDDYMNNMGKQVEQNYLFDIDDYGNAKLSKIGVSAIKIDTFKNILEFNHKGAFQWMMKYHFKNDMRKPKAPVLSLSSGMLSRAKKLVKENHDNEVRSNIQQFLELSDVEQTDILMGAGSKDIRFLAEVNDSIKDEANNIIRTRIIEECIKNKQFIKQCKYYHMTYYFTKKIYDESDVKYRISNAVRNNDNDELMFYNKLLQYGQHEIHDTYYTKQLRDKKILKYILEKIGYKNRKVGIENMFAFDPLVKEMYAHIKN